MNKKEHETLAKETSLYKQIARTRLCLLKSVVTRKNNQDSFKEVDNTLSRSSSSDSLPRLLKYCKDKSGSKSFEGEEGDFKNNSIHIEPDEEYFSCDNTGASSPSQIKREGIIITNASWNLLESRLLRSWSIHNITESVKTLGKRRRAKSLSSESSNEQYYTLMVKKTATLSLWDHLKENRPQQTGVMDAQMERGYDTLKLICDSIKNPEEQISITINEPEKEVERFEGYNKIRTSLLPYISRLKTEMNKSYLGYHNLEFTNIVKPGPKPSLQRLEISHTSHINDVKVDQNFKNMTKRLVDLADQVTGEPSPSKRKSMKLKRKSKYKKRSDRTITWDHTNENEYFEMDQKINNISKPRKISACVHSLSEEIKSGASSIKHKEDEGYYLFSQTDEIKEDPLEGEGEACIQSLLNLNLCQSENLELERRRSEVYTVSGKSDAYSFSSQLNMKPQLSHGVKKTKKKRFRRGTFVSSSILPECTESPCNFMKPVGSTKSFSPMSKKARQKSKFCPSFSDTSNTSPAGKFSSNSSTLKKKSVHVFKRDGRQFKILGLL